MNYQKILQRAQKEKANVRLTIGTLIIFNSEQIVEGIKTRWAFGAGVNGGKIGQYASASYKAFKVDVKKSKAGGFVDLTLTGALGEGLTIRKLNDKRYEIFSTDSKFKKIADKYGIQQFNLDEQQQEELFDMLYFFALENYIDNVWLV
jgi:hypothetical protein